MPWTWATFVIATLAITGIVPLSGFFSKDAILHGAHTTRAARASPGWATSSTAIGLFGALCTAFYMTRLYVLTFEGKRAPDARVPHAHESGFADGVGRWWCWPSSRWSAWSGGFRISAPGPGGETVALMEGYLAPAIDPRRPGRPPLYETVKHAHASPLPGSCPRLGGGAHRRRGGVAGLPVVAASAGREATAHRPSPSSGAGRGASSTWTRSTTSWSSVPSPRSRNGLYKVVDAGLIDGVAVGGTAGVLRRMGSWLRYTQTGNAQNYATVMAVGLLVSIGVVLTWALQ